MKLKSYGLALMAVVGIGACAGMALAQALDPGPARGGPPGAAQGMRLLGLARAAMEPLVLFGGEDAKTQVANTDKGVDITVTAAKPEDVAKLQEAVQSSVTRVQQAVQAAEAVRGRMGEQGARPRARRDLRALLASGQATIDAKKTDNGMIVSLSSDKPEVVQMIQQDAPKWVAEERTREQRMAELRGRAEKAREAMALLGQDDVKLEVTQADNGITVQVTSANPDVAKQIKENLPAYFEAQKELGKNAGQLQRRAGGIPGGPLQRRRAGGPPEGPPPAAGQ